MACSRSSARPRKRYAARDLAPSLEPATKRVNMASPGQKYSQDPTPLTISSSGDYAIGAPSMSNSMSAKATPAGSLGVTPKSALGVQPTRFSSRHSGVPQKRPSYKAGAGAVWASTPLPESQLREAEETPELINVTTPGIREEIIVRLDPDDSSLALDENVLQEQPSQLENNITPTAVRLSEETLRVSGKKTGCIDLVNPSNETAVDCRTLQSTIQDLQQQLKVACNEFRALRHQNVHNLQSEGRVQQESELLVYWKTKLMAYLVEEETVFTQISDQQDINEGRLKLTEGRNSLNVQWPTSSTSGTAFQEGETVRNTITAHIEQIHQLFESVKRKRTSLTREITDLRSRDNVQKAHVRRLEREAKTHLKALCVKTTQIHELEKAIHVYQNDLATTQEESMAAISEKNAIQTELDEIQQKLTNSKFAEMALESLQNELKCARVELQESEERNEILCKEIKTLRQVGANAQPRLEESRQETRKPTKELQSKSDEEISSALRNNRDETNPSETSNAEDSEVEDDNAAGNQLATSKSVQVPNSRISATEQDKSNQIMRIISNFGSGLTDIRHISKSDAPLPNNFIVLYSALMGDAKDCQVDVALARSWYIGILFPALKHPLPTIIPRISLDEHEPEVPAPHTAPRPTDILDRVEQPQVVLLSDPEPPSTSSRCIIESSRPPLLTNSSSDSCGSETCRISASHLYPPRPVNGGYHSSVSSDWGRSVSQERPLQMVNTTTTDWEASLDQRHVNITKSGVFNLPDLSTTLLSAHSTDWSSQAMQLPPLEGLPVDSLPHLYASPMRTDPRS